MKVCKLFLKLLRTNRTNGLIVIAARTQAGCDGGWAIFIVRPVKVYDVPMHFYNAHVSIV